MKLKFMSYPLEKMNADELREGEIDAIIFTNPTFNDEQDCIRFVRFTLKDAIGQERNVEIRSDAASNLTAPILTNFAELVSSLFSVLRNPTLLEPLGDYQSHFLAMQTALRDVYANEPLNEDYRKRYEDIYNLKYGWKLSLMNRITFNFSRYVNPEITSSSQTESLYEKTRREGSCGFSVEKRGVMT